MPSASRPAFCALVALALGSITAPAQQEPDAGNTALFERKEADRTLALRVMATGKARETLAKYQQTLARYQGRSGEGAAIGHKLRNLVLPSVGYSSMGIEEIAKDLGRQCADADTGESDPSKKGVRFVIGSSGDPVDPTAPEHQPPPYAKDVRLISVRYGVAADILDYVCLATGLVYRIEDHAVHFLGVPALAQEESEAGLAILMRKPVGKAFREFTAEQLDARAAAFFAHTEIGNAIALQMMAVAKAETDLARCEQNSPRDRDLLLEPGLIQQKFHRILFPSVTCEDCSIQAIVMYIQIRSRELDSTETDPARKGVSFVIGRLKTTAVPFEPDDPDASICNLGAEEGLGRCVKQLSLKNASLGEVLKEICGATGTTFRAGDSAVIITDK